METDILYKAAYEIKRLQENIQSHNFTKSMESVLMDIVRILNIIRGKMSDDENKTTSYDIKVECTYKEIIDIQNYLCNRFIDYDLNPSDPEETMI